jgi:putative FmdB family regulatory protein
VPTYEFRCRTCDAVFEERRPMAEAGDAAECPAGHADTIRLISLFAATRNGNGNGTGSPAPVLAGGTRGSGGSGGGGCCGGACGCR